MKTLPQKTIRKFSLGRSILIVGAALILAIMLYSILDGSNDADAIGAEGQAVVEPEIQTVIGVEPASFQDIRELREGTSNRLRLSGRGEAGGVVVITNRGERRRQVRINDTGQWEVSIDIESGPMVLEAQLYVTEDTPGIRSEETVFRLPVTETETETADLALQTEAFETSALILVTAPGGPSRVIQSPFGGSPTSGPLSLSVLDYDSTGGIIITGMSSVPGRVRFYAKGTVIGETGIGVGGRWNFIAGRMLPPTNITLTAELIPAPGGTSDEPLERSRVSIPFNFIPPLKEENTDGSGAISVTVEPQYWQVRRTLIGGGGQSTVIYGPNVTVVDTEEVSDETVTP